MEVLLKREEDFSVVTGDFICVNEDTIRQIIYVDGTYYALDLEDGRPCFSCSTIAALIADYERNFVTVRIIKNENIRLEEL